MFGPGILNWGWDGKLEWGCLIWIGYWLMWVLQVCEAYICDYAESEIELDGVEWKLTREAEGSCTYIDGW
jgi:hypothetical protein